MTLGCNGVTMKQFELPNDPNFFRGMYLSPNRSKPPHRMSVVNLSWADDFFRLS